MPSEFGFEPVPKPHVWKTVDGGSSWYKLQEFDFQTIDAFQNTLLAPTGEQIVRPHFDTSDAVVDENGELNLFSRIRCGFSTNPDSLGFIYGAIESQDESPTEFLYHVKTDGETNWEANLISEVVNSDNAAAFSLGTIALNLKPQISRTPDGSKIFFSYHKSLQSLSLVDANIFARGYDVSTDIYTSEKNLTENTDYEDVTFFQTMAPICKVGGECQMYELPIAFVEPGSDDLDECQHLYLYGAGFDDINFDPASIDEVEIDLSLNVFPNPSTGMFSLNLPNDVSGEVQVFDISGKLIHQAQNQFGLISLDLSDQPKGSYTVKYMNEKEVKTSAIIIR